MQNRIPGNRDVRQWAGSFESGITRTGNWKGKWRRGEKPSGAKWFAEACALYGGHGCYSSTATASSGLSREIKKTSNLSIYSFVWVSTMFFKIMSNSIKILCSWFGHLAVALILWVNCFLRNVHHYIILIMLN